MDNLQDCFHHIKISALSKAKAINSFVKYTTIGPNSTLNNDDEEEEEVTPCHSTNSSPKKLPIPVSPARSSPKMAIVNKYLSEMESERQGKVREAMNSHYSYIMEFSKNQMCNSKLQFQRQQQILLNEAEHQEFIILQALEQHDKDLLVKHQQLLQYYQELAEKRKQNNRELEEQEKRRQKINAIISDIKNNQMEFRHVYQEIINMFKNCNVQADLKEALGDIPKQLKALPDSMEEIVIRCKKDKISFEESRRSGELVEKIKEIHLIIQQKIATLTAPQEPEIKSNTQSMPVPIQEQPPRPTEAVHSVAKVIIQPSEINASEINKFVSKSSLRIYSELQSYLENYTKAYEMITQNDACKQFRFDCKKAINIPVNAISAVSPQHLLDKYNRLYQLLAGKLVNVGNAQVCATQHPQGLAFCTNLLAKKFVLQGDLMISSNPEAAFCYAAIIVALWYDYPEFGKIILAHFYKQCPHLVPFYPPRAVGQTDEEFYLSQGYQYTENGIEKQDKYLKRMTGIMRLYAAIVIARPKQGQQQNPHGLTEGWRWLAAFLNLEPKPDITATMLHVFLETAGSTLQSVYGKSFIKLMIYIYNVYLPIIQKIDTGGPVTRLEVLLQEYRKTGCFDSPHGMLDNNFW